MAHNLDMGSLSLQDGPGHQGQTTGGGGAGAGSGSFGFSAGGGHQIYSSGDYSSFRSADGGRAHTRGPSANGVPGGADASASARFERFFASGDQGPSAGLAGGAGAGAFGSFGSGLAVPAGLPGSGGPFGSGSGSGSGSRRGLRTALPAQWGAPHPAGADMGPGAGVSSYNLNTQYNASPLDDEVIPTAIVIKNIPFSVKREQLLGLMEELTIPMPYAFNYHFDQGMFRGLAFANFRSPEEADAVVAALNGFDVSGRKLKVEYKKVLQAGEKERIEKEKAIKRMQSMQLEKEKDRRRQEEGTDVIPPPPVPQQPIGSMRGHSPPGNFASLGDPYSGQQRSPVDAMAASSTTNGAGGLRVPLTADALRSVPNAHGASSHSPASDISGGLALGAGGAGAIGANGKREELDLNEPGTLEIYSRVLLFKDDRMRDELSFSKSLSPMERRTVHLVAQKLGLYHYSMGEGDERCVIVSKNEMPQAHRPLRTQASTIGRSHRGEALNFAAGSNGLLSPGSSATTGRAGLRMKKSAPDMKRLNNDYGFGAPSSPGGGSGGSGTSPGRIDYGLNAFKSNGNLREGYSSTTGRRGMGSTGAGSGAAGLQSLFASPYEVPPVPQLGGPLAVSANFESTSTPSAAGFQYSNGSAGGHAIGNGTNGNANLLRQPRGPPTPGATEQRNFSVRSRIAVGSGSGAGAAANGGGGSALLNGTGFEATPQPPALSFGMGGGDSQFEQGIDAQSHTPLEI